MDASKLAGLSETEAYQKIGEFWDTHDFTEFDDPNAPDVEFEIVGTVSIEASLLSEIEQQASQRGVEPDALVNLWLRQKLAEQKTA